MGSGRVGTQRLGGFSRASDVGFSAWVWLQWLYKPLRGAQLQLVSELLLRPRQQSQHNQNDHKLTENGPRIIGCLILLLKIWSLIMGYHAVQQFLLDFRVQGL